MVATTTVLKEIIRPLRCVLSAKSHSKLKTRSAFGTRSIALRLEKLLSVSLKSKQSNFSYYYIRGLCVFVAHINAYMRVSGAVHLH